MRFSEDERDIVLAMILEAREWLAKELASHPGTERGASAMDDQLGVFLMDRLHQCFPEDGIVCEDQKEIVGSSNRAFLVDPHDGTASALRGAAGSSISLGAVAAGELLHGVVAIPRLPFSFGDGSLTVSWFLGDATLQVDGAIERSDRDEDCLNQDSIVLVGDDLGTERMEQNQACVAPSRVLPCPSLATRLALVSIGAASTGVSLYRGTADWDYCGGHALLRGAGGDLFDDRQRRITWTGSRSRPNERLGYFGARSSNLALEVSRRYKPMIDERRSRSS